MFKNAITYAVTPGFRIDGELLHRRPARDCGPTEHKTDGFTSPCPHSTQALLHSVAGYQLICWQTVDKILPGSVIEEAIDEKVAEIEQREGRNVGRRERKEIKENVTMELLPRAFTQKRKTHALLGGGYLVINTSSPARAEALLESLRRALDGKVPVAELRTEKMPAMSMATWISAGEPPYGFTIDQDCVLEGVQEVKPQVKFVRTDLDADDVKNRVAHGYMPKKLGMTYDNKMSFVVSDHLHLTKIAMLDLVEKAEREALASDAAEIFDGDVTICAGEIIRMLNTVIDELGGLVKPEKGDLLDKAAA